MKTLLTLAQLMTPIEELPPNSPPLQLEQPAYCGPLSEINNELNTVYEEVPSIIWGEDGTVRNGIFYFNEKKQTVTIVLAYPNGVGCIISSGKVKYNSMLEETSDDVKGEKGQQL